MPRSPDRGTAGSGPVSLAGLVAARRAELGLSLRGLQERSGIHYSHLSKVESGSDGLGISAMAGLSKALNLPLGELLGAAGIEANLGLPSFSSYLDAVVPDLAREARGELERVFERLTGRLASQVPASRAVPAESAAGVPGGSGVSS